MSAVRAGNPAEELKMDEDLGILADDVIRSAFIEECERQNEWKQRVDAVVESNRKLRQAE